MIHPDLEDPTKGRPDVVRFHLGYDVRDRFAPDHYFLRDGRFQGVVTNFLATSWWCHDIWTPLEFGWDVAQNRTKRLHIVDEYCVSRNLARFGIKFDGLIKDHARADLFWRHFGSEGKSKEEYLRDVEEARQILVTYSS
jgi:hypothetical protein